MSRAYRITVSEKCTRIVCADDHASTQLELLPLLPQEDLATLLADELKRRGFVEQPSAGVETPVLTRQDGDVIIEVDSQTATITVRLSKSKEVELAASADGHSWDGNDGTVRGQLRDQALQKIEKLAAEETNTLQTEATSALEEQLREIRQELDQITNKVTAEALKRKAAQLGQIKEVNENPQTGAMTIVLEV